MKRWLPVLILVLVIASLAATCNTSPRWKLVGEGEGGFRTVVIEKTWLPVNSSNEFYVLVRTEETHEVGRLLVAGVEYANLEEGDVVFVTK